MPLPAIPVAVYGAYYVLKATCTAAMFFAPYFHEEELPDITATAEAVVQAVRVDADALVADTAERAKQDQEKSSQGNARINEENKRFSLSLTAMEGHEAAMKEVITVAVASNKPKAKALQRLSEAQVKINSGLELQQSGTKAIANKLEGLPSLLRVKQENKTLKLENKALNKKLRDSLSCIEEFTDLASEQQVEIEALQQKLKARPSVENKESASVSFFSRMP